MDGRVACRAVDGWTDDRQVPEWRGYSGLKTPLRSTQKFLRRDVDGRGWRYAAFGRSGAFGARGTSAPHAMLSSCAFHVTRVCSLAAVLRPSAAAATGSAAEGRAGAFGARWHLHWHAIISSRAVQSRASARSQALDATCVSRKNYVVHGDASFCAERKIPTNIAGIPDKLTVSFRRANAQEAKSTSTDKTH